MKDRKIQEITPLDMEGKTKEPVSGASSTTTRRLVAILRIIGFASWWIAMTLSIAGIRGDLPAHMITAWAEHGVRLLMRLFPVFLLVAGLVRLMRSHENAFYSDIVYVISAFICAMFAALYFY